MNTAQYLEHISLSKIYNKKQIVLLCEMLLK